MLLLSRKKRDEIYVLAICMHVGSGFDDRGTEYRASFFLCRLLLVYICIVYLYSAGARNMFNVLRYSAKITDPRSMFLKRVVPKKIRTPNGWRAGNFRGREGGGFWKSGRVRERGCGPENPTSGVDFLKMISKRTLCV